MVAALKQVMANRIDAVIVERRTVRNARRVMELSEISRLVCWYKL